MNRDLNTVDAMFKERVECTQHINGFSDTVFHTSPQQRYNKNMPSGGNNSVPVSFNSSFLFFIWIRCYSLYFFNNVDWTVDMVLSCDTTIAWHSASILSIKSLEECKQISCRCLQSTELSELKILLDFHKSELFLLVYAFTLILKQGILWISSPLSATFSDNLLKVYLLKIWVQYKLN